MPMDGLTLLLVLSVVSVPVTLFTHGRLAAPGISYRAAALGQLAAAGLVFLSVFIASWDGYHDTGTEPIHTLDEAFTTMGVGAGLTAWVWVRMLDYRSAAAVVAGLTAGAAIVALVTWTT